MYTNKCLGGIAGHDVRQRNRIVVTASVYSRELTQGGPGFGVHPLQQGQTRMRDNWASRSHDGIW